MPRAWIYLGASILWFACSLPAQEKPLTINGTFSSGFYNTFTQGGGNGNQSIMFVPVGAAFDINAYYLTPDLVQLSLQPELNAGPQASDAGFQGGNGVRMKISLLRKRAFPLTFRYSNVQVEDAYFGSLTQLSSFTLKNRSKEVGLSTELKHAGLPTALIDWGSSSVDSQSGLTAIPDFRSHSNHLSVDSHYQRWGWDFQGFTHYQQQTSDLFAPLGGTINSSSLEQKVAQYQAYARRSFPRDSELFLDAGSQSTANLLFNQPIDLSARYLNANLRVLQKSRWRSSLRASYNSNIAGLFLTQLLGGLGGNGSIAPNSSALDPFQHSISNLNFNGFTSVTLWHGFGLFGSADRTGVTVGGDSALSSTYFSSAGGLNYSGKFRWGSFSGQFGREFGIGSVTGQTGTIAGQNYAATIQHGDRDGLQLDFSVHGTDQSVRNALPVNDQSFAWDGAVSRRVFGQFSGSVGGGWQQSRFTSTGNDFHTNGYTVHGGIEHPRFQLSGSLNSSVGNALQAYSQQFGGIGVQSALATPLPFIPSDFRGTSFTLHANLTRKLELSALWTRSVQHIEGVVSNNLKIIDVHATYHFRRLQMEFGFFRSDQMFNSYFLNYPQTQRGRVYFRVWRSAKLL